jgi:HAD superfamily hydrolase (TIGR01549 family)
MRFYRRLSSIKAISFDLDDTLYNNYPVMIVTEAKMIAYFAEQLPAKTHKNYDSLFWCSYRDLALQENVALKHDVGELRLQSYYLGIKSLGFSSSIAMNMARQALAYFVEQRSNFSVPDSIHHLLAQLKKHWPLIAISNGNVDTHAIGIADYFDAIFHAGDGLKQKPEFDMFNRACQRFNLKPKQLLHVGDCGVNDVLGAIRFGCQTAWVSTYNIGEPLQLLPNIELTDVTELHRLI